METTLKNHKLALLIGHGFFIIYLYMSLFFFQERTMLFDSANFSFQIIQNQDFFFPLHRYGCGITQILPLTLLKLGLNLKGVLVSYSFSLAFFYYFLFLIIGHLLKDTKLIYIYLLTLCLTYRNTFYFGVSEFSQGLALSVLLLGIVKALINNSNNNWKKIIFFFASLTLIFSQYYFHPLSIISIVFVLTYILVKSKKYMNKELLFLFVFTISWYGYNLLIKSKTGGYESERMESFKLFFSTYDTILDLPSARYFFKFLKGTPLISFVIILFGALWLFVKKRHILSILFLLFPFSYLVFIIIAYHKGEAPNMYEQYYIYFGFFGAIVLSDVFALISPKKGFWTTILLLIMGLQGIYLSRKQPEIKKEFISSLVQKAAEYNYDKYLIKESDYPFSFGWSTFALPVETLLMSKLKMDKVITFYVAEDEKELKWPREKNRFFCKESIHPRLKLDELNSFFPLNFNSPYNQLFRLHSQIYFANKILLDYKWRKEIEQKAKINNILFLKQLREDAEWLAQKELKEQEQIIKQIIQIKKDALWMKSIKEKARENNVGVEEVLWVDAKYVLDQKQKAN